MEFPQTTEQVAECLVEAALSNDRIGALFQTAPDAWLVQFKAGHACRLEFAANPPRLGLTVELGSPPAQRRQRVHDVALSYSLMWRQNGGARLGQSGEDGPMVLLCEISHLESPQALANRLEKFGAIGVWWRAFVRSDSGEYAPITASDFLAMRA